MAEKDIRWRQRFQNLKKAYQQLKAGVEQKSFTDLEKEGIVQRFEYTFELVWKTLKDYLESQDVIAEFPRDIFKAAFRYNLINNGEIWMDMLEKRNLLSHTYNEKNAKIAFDSVTKKYFYAVQQIVTFLGSK